jgi:hypothetical protein
MTDMFNCLKIVFFLLQVKVEKAALTKNVANTKRASKSEEKRKWMHGPKITKGSNNYNKHVTILLERESTTSSK